VCTHPERAAHVGATARDDVGLRFVPAAQGRALAAFLSSVTAGLRAPHPAPPAVAALDERALVRRFPGEVARVALEPADRPDHLAGVGGGFTAPLADGAVLVQRFPSRHDGLRRLDVFTVTYEQALDHTLLAAVRRDDASVVATQEIWAGSAPARGWLAIDLPAEPASAGRTYTLELRARGSGGGNAISFGVSAEMGEPYTHDGMAGGAPLSLRSFGAWNDGATDAGAARTAVARS
jgi:hypothetical protein